MIKELKYFFYVILIFFFFFLLIRFYISDENIKNSYRTHNNIDNQILTYSKNLITLKNDTNDIISYVENVEAKSKKKYFFWNLLKNE